MKDNPMSFPDFYEVMENRRSVRYYDPTFEIPTKEIEELIREAGLAPSAHNLQPWRFLVITDQDQKRRLLPIAFGQQQVVDASAVIVVMADKNAYSEENAQRVLDMAVEAGYMSEDAKNKMLKNIKSLHSMVTNEQLRDIMIVDCSLASMQFMLAAKAKGYDTVPMMGYNTGEFIEAFNVPEHFISLLMIPIGKAVKPGHPTARLSTDETIFWNTVGA